MKAPDKNVGAVRSLIMAMADAGGEDRLSWGQEVWKTGLSEGPGRVVGLAVLSDGSARYLIAARIEGGIGDFLHVYPRQSLISDPAEVESRKTAARA